MIISTDNVKIEQNISTYKCPIINEGTVLLFPSQVKKYLGSYLKHKIVGMGIILPKGYILDVVTEETIDNIKWSLIIYNGRYYYTPSEYIDTKSIIKISNIESKDILSKPEPKMILMNKISGDGDEDRINLYSKEYLLAITNSSSVNFYNDSSPDSGVRLTVPDNRPFVIQSEWKNDEYDKKYFATQTFTNGATYVENNGDIKILGLYSNNKPKYYAMIYKDTECKYPDGETYLPLVRGDMVWPYGQDWDNHLHLNAYQTGKGIITYTYPANCASPLADADDMFDQNRYGTLKAKQTIVGFDLHRRENAESVADKMASLNDISAGSLNLNSKFKELMSAANVSVSTSLSLCGIGNSYMHRINTSEQYIVTNYIEPMNGSKIGYYICFKDSSQVNGAVQFCAIPDVGVEYISYDPRLPDYSNANISGSNDPEAKIWAEENTKVDISGLADNRDYSAGNSSVYNETQDNKIYKVTLKPGDGSSDMRVPGIDYNAGTVPPDYEGDVILSDVDNYNLRNEAPYTTRHLTHMNRFHLPTNNSGLSTKSFIFVSRPDLNLFNELDRSGRIDPWAMNPNLKRLPGFKYLARIRGTQSDPGIGNTIMNSLEYYGTSGLDTPWLSIFTNQAKGYSISDREMDVTEMGETFHGNKVLYAEPTFRHKIGGTTTIPFLERRDLTLYYTLRMWIEYIQAVSLGYCKPRWCHMYNGEVDYAVSLYYIQTDETMENILYWEKLTGLIPLTVPDSFFEWSDGGSPKDMEYSITFAYSFRTVMDEYHLSEINNSYTKFRANGNNINGMPLIPKDTFSYVNNPEYNQLIGRVAMFYNQISDDENSFKSFLNNPELIKKYYYEPHTVSNGSGQGNANFLYNWNKDLQIHGIPYVKGPFIEHDQQSQMYKLRWV